MKLKNQMENENFNKIELYSNKNLWYNNQVAKMQYYGGIAFFLRERRSTMKSQ